MEEENNKQENNEVKDVVDKIVQEENNDSNAITEEKTKNSKTGFFYEMWEKYKTFVNDYLLTNIMIWVLAFASQLYEFFDGDNAETYGYCIFGISLSMAWMFVVETFKKKKEDRIVFYIGGFIAAIVSTVVLRSYQDNDFFEYIAIGMVSGYSALGFITLYKLYVDSKLKWGKYALVLMGNQLIAGVVQGLVTIGIMAISAILFNYVLEGLFHDTSELYIHELLLLASLVAPTLSLYALVNTKTKVEYNIIEVLFSYVITPIITVAIVLLYLYILRIVLLSELTATAMFGIIFALFIPTYMTWIICSHTKEERPLINKIAKKLPYLFIPLVLLQVYGLFLRINQYGITIVRYMGVMAIILEAFAVALTVYKEEKYIGRILWVAAAILIISFCLPVVNVYNIEALSQSNRLKHIMPEGTNFRDLSKEDRKSVYSIYIELSYSEIGKKYLPDYVKKQDDTIRNYNSYSDEFYDDYYKDYYNNYNYDYYDYYNSFNDYNDYNNYNNNVVNTIQEV